MKNLFALIIIGLLFIQTGFSQSKTYWTSGGEMLFSFASIVDNGVDKSSTLRWAPVINIQGKYNYDFSQNVGIYTGLSVRNVGYIYNDYQDKSDGYYYKKKFRSYNLGLPLGLKFGNLNRTFLYAGYEIELPFVYKEKTFDQGDKIGKITGWFSNRMELFQHGPFAGIQFPYGFTLKFKYYVSQFHNQNFTENSGIKPYSGLESHIMYISAGYNIAWR